jgi:molybdopterin-guanine dinucleotide biosynthesis protein A
VTSEPVGVVLAGGMGRRIGGSKATVALAGRPLLHYPVDVLASVLDEVAVICKEDTVLPVLPAAVSVWCEAETRSHPLIGVAAALRCAGGRPVVVVAGDMPLVTAEAIRALVAAPEAPAAVVRACGRVQPLLARYAPAVLPALDAMDPDERAVDVIGRLDPVIVDIADDHVAFNVNAPEDVLLAEGERIRRDT